MRYAAETEQMERDGPPERPEDWDSLSDRIRKSRLKPKTLLQQQKGELVLYLAKSVKFLTPQKPFLVIVKMP